MPPVVSLFALKGGVGKTSAAVNLAWLSAQTRRRTLLWDLDPQAGASYLLRVKPKVKGGTRQLLHGETDPRRVIKSSSYDGLDVLPAEALYGAGDLDLDAAKKSERRVERVLRALYDDYDIFLLDCPPGPSLVAANIVRASDLVVVPVVPSPLSYRTLEQVREFVSDTSPGTKLLAYPSMVESRRALHRDVTSRLQAGGEDVAAASIPASATVERMGERRAPVTVSAPKVAASTQYRELWNELLRRLPIH